MIVTIHQPQYLPWIGYFHKILNSDIFVLLDCAQYSRNNFFNRNKILQGKEILWLTVPVKNEKDCLLKDTLIDNSQPWQKKHWKSIKHNYEKSLFFKKYEKEFEEIYNKRWEKLSELNEAIIKLITDKLGIKIQIIKESELDIDGKSTERLINICKKLGADTYFSGIGAKEYMDKLLFEKEGIKLIYQNFKHPIYPQKNKDFESHLSIIDLLFNCGDRSIEILKGEASVN